MDLRSKDAIETSKQHNINMNNILIAEFNQKYSEGFGLYDFNGCHYKLDELEFHTSWDWLMPVVQKIKDTPTYGSTDGIDFVLTCDLTKESLYESVVEFIKYHNEEKN